MNVVVHHKIKQMSPQFLVADLDRSVGFYVKELGFNVDFRYDDFYTGISKDGFSVHLKSGKPSIEERRNKRNNEDLDIVFSVDGIDDLYGIMTSKSIEFIQPLREMDYGKEFYIADPDGYLIGFFEGA